MVAFCHYEIRNAAQDLAADFYEVGAQDNNFRADYPSRFNFVRNHWPKFVQPAKHAAAQRLDDPGTPIAVKIKIAEVLALDDTAPKGAMGGALPVAHDDRDWHSRYA